ncbi:lactate utilization protein [Accumulibacter sp.]|uniref:LutC/YkgG family protein n=1 Tax=Accumulibacter sp. TaxID=2053492 RepID=UPI0025D9C709|nr:lactate utilization protein [Accumulibacter sp.]MCM8594267.1 lactate utilization protein [Accumulibacter sp.]MCM8627910.1 lactate utilization protein [Accumulibacter sp.]MDS4048411.1 lactate utilization protein [Accumulibacter sp.]
MSARERILERLRSVPVVPLPEPDLGAFQADPAAVSTRSSRTARIERFCERMNFWHGQVIRVTRRNWAASLRDLCADRGLRSLVHGQVTEFADELRAAGLPGLRVFDRPVDSWKAELFAEVDAGLTSTRGAIAETGTLIIWPDEREPRLLSLVPPIHFALLDADRIHDSLPEAMREQGWAAAMPANALLVSGPSKTADIQVTLAYGAHGPKELIVLLIVDEEEAR